MTLDRPSTLHDVADKVGVSARTVSRVVRNEGGFSEGTRARVMAAVEELDYRPNVHARGLISGRSGTIGLVAPVLSDPFFPEVADGVQRAARAEGLTLLLALTDAEAQIEREVLISLEGHSPDGVIIFPDGSPESLTPFLDRGMRMIVVDAGFAIDHPNAVEVRSDLAAGARDAVDRLLGRGCRQLAMLAPDFAEVRRAGFVRALPPTMEPLVVETAITLEGGRTATSTLLSERPDVDGLFAFNDVMAVGALQAALEAGRRVPDELAVIGVDDIQMSSMLTPSLSTIRIDRERLGAEAVRQVVALSRGEVRSEPVVLPVELIERQSA